MIFRLSVTCAVRPACSLAKAPLITERLSHAAPNAAALSRSRLLGATFRKVRMSHPPCRPHSRPSLCPRRDGENDGHADGPPSSWWSRRRTSRPGVYPIRLETPDGISNVLLFTVGTFPEFTEEESSRYSEPHRNDSIENAEADSKHACNGERHPCGR